MRHVLAVESTHAYESFNFLYTLRGFHVGFGLDVTGVRFISFLLTTAFFFLFPFIFYYFSFFIFYYYYFFLRKGRKNWERRARSTCRHPKNESKDKSWSIYFRLCPGTPRL